MAVTVESRRHLVVKLTGVLTENNFFFCLVSTDMCPVVECKYIYLSTTQGTCTLAEHWFTFSVFSFDTFSTFIHTNTFTLSTIFNIQDFKAAQCTKVVKSI